MGFTLRDYNTAVAFFNQKDPKIAEVMIKVGYTPLPPRRNLFALMIGSIIGQKIRFNLARSQRGKLYTEMGKDDFTLEDFLSKARSHLQVDPSSQISLSELSEKGLLFLEEIGINEPRLGTIQRVVYYLQNAQIVLTHPSELDQLLKISGIGPWTINNTKIMWSLNEDEKNFNDCLLLEDLIIRRGLENLYGANALKHIETQCQAWSPWKGIVTWYLWKAFT
jgi:3-methyladenine DNA glycosylase/8-oxoguanine DNA glycosylase